LGAVSKLTCLKTFHFPIWSPLSSDSDDNDNDTGRSENTLKWPDSLETFHIPRASDRGNLPALREAPTLLSTWIIEDGVGRHADVLYSVFSLVGAQILTLKVKYNEEWPRLREYVDVLLFNFPNFLHLSIRSCFIHDGSVYNIDLDTDHPLRSITIYLKRLSDIFDHNFQQDLEGLLDEDRLPSINKIE
jgi:hypothetical protein